MSARVHNYSTTLPRSGPGVRPTLGSAVSVVLHVTIIALALYGGSRPDRKGPLEDRSAAAVRPIQLDFAPPRPTPTPRVESPPIEPNAPLEPLAPLTPGPDETAGSTARVSPTPEPEPNAPPEATRSEATRPDPGNEDAVTDGPAAPSPEATTPSMLGTNAPTAMETEARRIFGRPSSRLGPLTGSRENRPWETAEASDSRGCDLPEEEQADSTIPKGMAVIAGRIYHQDTGQPLPGARLQILGTPYGTFANDRGEYRLMFDRTLVNRCRTQSVRVSAPGYRGRDVLLYLGERANGDVPLSRF